MSTIAVSAIRQRVATAIASAMSASGWQQSATAPDAFGTAEGDNLAHKCFTVATSERIPVGDRQKVTTMCSTPLVVRWMYNLGANDQLNDYDGALDAEAAICVAAMSVSQSANLHLTLGPSRWSVDDQGWMSGAIEIVALHQFALT